jgi:hypothetical protein
MANISSSFKKASELYQRALQQYQAKEKEQLAIINQFKVGDVTIKSKLKPQLIALHKEMQHYQELVDRAETAFERALVSEPVNLGEDTMVKNKKTGNVYSVKKANPAIHTKPSASDIAQAKADNGGDVKAEPKVDGMATVNGIASTTGLRAQAVAGWADENGVNLSKVENDLKSKKLKPMDFMTAVVGNPGNKYAKDIIAKYSQKAEPTKGPELDVDKQSHIKDIPQKFRSMVSMKIDQLAKAAADAKAAGEKAPNFNLCDITIPGTNLYCKGNKGIPREDMPQFKGYAKPGSIADKLPKNSDGEVDTEAQFKVLLKRNGVAVSEPQEVAADQLKATQTELVGAKVAGMTKALETEPNHPKITAPIYVSNDGYVLDGHHRWAAVTSSAVASGKPAMMNVRVIDMPIKDLVKISNDFADQIGIQQKKADANAEAPKKEVTEVTTNDWHFKKILQMWDKANSFGKKKIGTVLCRNPKASRNDIIEAMRDSDYKEITHFTDKLHVESVITEKQLKGLEGISTNTSLEKISKDQKLKIIKAPGNIVDFIVPKGVSRNFWQVMGTGKIKKNTDGEYYLEGKVINSPMFKSIDDLVKGVLWKSMEERRRFNEGVIKEDTDTSAIIKDLDKVRHDLIKKVDVLIAKKKKLYSNVDITSPMSADEKQLDKDIQSIFSQIQSLIQQKRKIKTENVVVEDMDTTADESGMFISSITSAMESAQGIQQTIQAKGENFDVPAWVQAKTALASDYLHSINRYYKGNPDQD